MVAKRVRPKAENKELKKLGFENKDHKRDKNPTEPSQLNSPMKKYADLTEDDLKKMAFLSGVGLTLVQICYCLKINYYTISNSEHVERVMSALDEGRANAKKKVNIALFNKACEGDVQAIKWWDTTRGDYKETVEHKVSLEVSALLPEQRRERIKELSAKLDFLPQEVVERKVEPVMLEEDQMRHAMRKVYAQEATLSQEST